MVLIEVVAFVFGAIVGSFLNVVVYRLGSGRTLGGRSACLSCGKTLGVPDLVPILSYLFLRGRCRSCGSHISIQYPLVEFATALTFLLIARQTLEPLPMAALFVLSSFLVAIAAYDIRHKIVPDVLVYPFDALALAFIACFSYVAGDYTLLFMSLAAGIGFALPLFLIWLFSKGRAMGLGDAKLALGLGFMLGPAGAISAFVFSFWIGAIVGIGLILAQRFSLRGTASALTMKSEIPFAPFLIVAAALVRLLGIELPQLESFLYGL